MDEILVKHCDGVQHVYKPKCGCPCQNKKEEPEESVSLPPMLIVDNCNCNWTLSIITIDGVDYWAIDGVVLVDRNWNPISVDKLILEQI